MPPEPGPGRPGHDLDRPLARPEPRIRVTWLETSIPSQPAPVARLVTRPATPAGPGWAPYLLAGLAGVLLLLATVAWPLWEPVGRWLEEAYMQQAGPRP